LALFPDTSIPFPWLRQPSAQVIPPFIHGCIPCHCLPSIPSSIPWHIAVPLGPCFYFRSKTSGSLLPLVQPIGLIGLLLELP
jgi:hypothetical protein